MALNHAADENRLKRGHSLFQAFESLSGYSFHMTTYTETQLQFLPGTNLLLYDHLCSYYH